MRGGYRHIKPIEVLDEFARQGVEPFLARKLAAVIWRDIEIGSTKREDLPEMVRGAILRLAMEGTET